MKQHNAIPDPENTPHAVVTAEGSRGAYHGHEVQIHPQKSASGKELQHVELALLSVAHLVRVSTEILPPELTIWQLPYTENVVRNKEFAIC